MDNYRSKGSKRNYEQQNSKQQREKRKSNFNYDSLNLNTRVNFISGGNNKESKNDNDDGNPSPPPPPQISSKPFEHTAITHDTPQLKGIGGKLLLQMGYEPGKGLGKNLQGIQVPIQAKPRYGRGAIGAYGPENINSKEAINAAKISRGFNNINKFVADEIVDLLYDDDHELINNVSDVNTNNEQGDDTVVKKLTNIVMALSDEANKITSTTSTFDISLEENNNYDINLLKNDLDINSSWKLSIICQEYPKLKLTEEQFEELEYKIFNLFYDSNDSNFNEPIQFHKTLLINGTMQFLCANESTKNWLYQIIDNDNLLNNINLKIVETDTLGKYEQIKLWLSGPKLSSDIILKTLQKQNHNLKTYKWRVYNLNYFRSYNTTELIVGIDCISLAELKKLDFKPFYRFGRCVVHLSK